MYAVTVTKNGIHRWTRVKNTPQHAQQLKQQPHGPATRLTPAARLTPNSPGRIVNIIDNGGTPFKVHLSKTSASGTADVYVQKVLTEEPQQTYEYLLWRSFDYDHVFIGLDPDEGKKRLGGLFGTNKVWWHGGNSLLLRLPSQEQDRDRDRPVYVFIGWEIYSFVPPDEILSYASTMGNSAVPYPYAIGRTNTYFMIANTFAPNSLLPQVFDLSLTDEERDPYGVYYQNDLLTGLPWTSMRDRNKKSKRWEATHKLRGRKVLHKRLW